MQDRNDEQPQVEPVYLMDEGRAYAEIHRRRSVSDNGEASMDVVDIVGDVGRMRLSPERAVEIGEALVKLGKAKPE